MGKLRCESSKSSNLQSFRQLNIENSPYSKNYKCYTKSDERDLLYKRQLVTKLTRKDLEDKYIELCDENFYLKRRNNEFEEHIKKLMTKISRLTENTGKHSRTSSSLGLISTLGSGCNKKLENRNIKSNRSDGNFQIHHPRSITSAPSKIKKNLSVQVDSSKANTIIKSDTVSKDEHEVNENKLISQSLSIRVENKSSGTKYDVNKSNNLEKNELNELKREIQKQNDCIATLTNERDYLKEKLNEIDLKQIQQTNQIEMKRLKRKLDKMKKNQSNIEKLFESKEIQLQDEKQKNLIITMKLNEEHNINETLTEELFSLKTISRSNEILKKQLTELEFDKKMLMEQQEKLSKLLQEATNSLNHQQTLSDYLTNSKSSFKYDKNELLKKLELMETEQSALNNLKIELFNKIRHLQDVNDKLIVDLEGLRRD